MFTQASNCFFFFQNVGQEFANRAYKAKARRQMRICRDFEQNSRDNDAQTLFRKSRFQSRQKICVWQLENFFATKDSIVARE